MDKWELVSTIIGEYSTAIRWYCAELNERHAGRWLDLRAQIDAGETDLGKLRATMGLCVNGGACWRRFCDWGECDACNGE